MNKLEQAARQALEALELHINGCGVAIATRIAYDALREALDHSGEANEMVVLTEEQAQKIEEALAESRDDILECRNLGGCYEQQTEYDKEQLIEHEEALALMRAAMAQEQAEQKPEYDLGIGRGSMTINRWVDDGKLGITGVKHDWDKIFTPKEQRTVAEQALQKLSDFQQSIEHDGHWSDCSTHNEPAYSNGECDCGGYTPKQAEHERKYGELAGTHNWTPPNYTDEQWQKLDQEYQDHVAEQEPVAWLIDWPDEPELGHYFAEQPNEIARSRPLYAAPFNCKGKCCE